VETVYLVGLFTGLGASLGLAFAGGLAGTRGGYAPAAVLAAAVAVLLGLLLAGWPEAVGGGVGGLLGGAGAGPVVRGTLERGGTRTGTALLFALVALGGAVLAVIPLVGYLEAIALPVLALRVRRRGGERYAGLRTLAK
jgi:hypothetical protein